MGKMGRERPTKRPVFGSDLPPPPRPPGPGPPGPPGQPGFGQRPGGSATLDRVRDFLDRAGFEAGTNTEAGME